jgi:hypothetical protein
MQMFNRGWLIERWNAELAAEHAVSLHQSHHLFPACPMASLQAYAAFNLRRIIAANSLAILSALPYAASSSRPQKCVVARHTKRLFISLLLNVPHARAVNSLKVQVHLRALYYHTPSTERPVIKKVIPKPEEMME